jgi:hypothetical protein
VTEPVSPSPQPDWAAVRADYEGTRDPLETLYRRHGITAAQVRAAKHQFQWQSRYKPSSSSRTDLIERLFKILKRQIKHMEDNKDANGDKEVALLGTLARNLKKLMSLQDADKGSRNNDKKAGDLADLRKRLVQRIGELKRR